MSIVDDIISRLPKYQTFREAFAAWDSESISEDTLDSAIWMLTCTAVADRDKQAVSGAVMNFFASRYMEWEVGNGGFSQAAYNISHLFDAAANGYDAIGHSAAADRIRDAKKLALKEHSIFERIRRSNPNIERIFSLFRQSSLRSLDSNLDEIGWWATTDRLNYVLQNRNEFLLLDEQTLQ